MKMIMKLLTIHFIYWSYQILSTGCSNWFRKSRAPGWLVVRLFICCCGCSSPSHMFPTLYNVNYVYCVRIYHKRDRHHQGNDSAVACCCCCCRCAVATCKFNSYFTILLQASARRSAGILWESHLTTPHHHGHSGEQQQKEQRVRWRTPPHKAHNLS